MKILAKLPRVLLLAAATVAMVAAAQPLGCDGPAKADRSPKPSHSVAPVHLRESGSGY